MEALGQETPLIRMQSESPSDWVSAGSAASGAEAGGLAGLGRSLLSSLCQALLEAGVQPGLRGRGDGAGAAGGRGALADVDMTGGPWTMSGDSNCADVERCVWVGAQTPDIPWAVLLA